MNDFVAEIDENVREAKREMDAINRELRHMPFGNDTYKFVMKEKPDRALFFRICRRLEKYMSSPQVYMNSARDDEEMENDIQEFMSIILAEEDEWEYTDYRRYFSYDMEISSRQGQTEITAELSKKQGSASNGEKQTPYFIILAASLLQCYPANTCCARLAFIERADRADGPLFRRKSLPGILCSPAGEDQQYRSVYRFNRQPHRDRTVYECGRRIGEAGIGNEEKKWRIGKSGKNSF